MKVLAEYDQHELGFRDPSDGPITFERQAARAVLRNTERQIAVMNFTKTGSYKLPGGGIDEGETPEQALHREIREETGYKLTAFEELGIVKEHRYYCGMFQTSYCFTATVGEFVGTDLTDEEASQGMNLQWFDTFELAIEAVKSGSVVDEDGSRIGLDMMQLRDATILEAAQK